MQDDLEEFIAKHRDQFDTSAPPPQVLNRISERMQPVKKNRPAGIVISFRTMRWAAACIVFFMVATVLLLKDNREETSPVVANTKHPVVQQVPNVAAQVETKPVESGLDAVDQDLLRRNETIHKKLGKRQVNKPQQVRFASLSNMNSPAGRISAANAIKAQSDQGNDVVDALVNTLNTDPNSNVRLAALDGLARFYREDHVRLQLVRALKKQHDPVVQVAMINLLVRMRASGILEQLDRMVNDDNANKVVRDCAYSGLLELKAI